MIDTHDVPVEIKVTRDPTGGHKVWIHAGPEGQLVLRVYRCELHLDGLALAEQAETKHAAE